MVKKRMRYWEVHYSVMEGSGWAAARTAIPDIHYMALPERPLERQFRKMFSDVNGVPIAYIHFQGCTELTKAEYNRAMADQTFQSP